MDEIDRHLAAELDEPAPETLRPRVMEAVRREAGRPTPIAFPWLRFAVGVAAGLLVCVLVAVEAPAVAARFWTN